MFPGDLSTPFHGQAWEGQGPSVFRPFSQHLHPLRSRGKRGARDAGPERAEPGPRPLHGPRGGSRGGEEVAAPRTGRRRPEASK